MAVHRRATIDELFPNVVLCLFSAGTAPDHRPPNFVNPPSLQPAVIVIAAVMVTLAFVVLAGRLFINRKSLQVSDCMLVPSFFYNFLRTS
jgi:hypothetical protein